MRNHHQVGIACRQESQGPQSARADEDNSAAADFRDHADELVVVNFAECSNRLLPCTGRRHFLASGRFSDVRDHTDRSDVSLVCVHVQPHRLVGRLGGRCLVGSTFVLPTVATCVDLVVHITKDGTGHRQVREVVAVPGRVEGDVVETADVFTMRGGRLARADGYPPHPERFAWAGLDLPALLAHDA